MTTARDVMHPGVQCIGGQVSLLEVAGRVRRLDIVAVPICGDDARQHGSMADRDIVVECPATGRGPRK